VLEFAQDGHRYMAGVGSVVDGRLAEIVLNAAKAGTHAEAGRDTAITASLLFQHGGSVDTLRHAVTREADGSAAGPLAAVLDILASEA
jgi:hypothetical protein